MSRVTGRGRIPRVPSAPFRDSVRLARLESHLLENITEPFPAVEAARLVKLHSAYFSAFFRARVGIQFHRWVQLVRLRKARELLRRTRLPISEVATRSGFGTTRSLQRAARKILGCSPREYRARYRRGILP